jgi:hypothetical protein
MMERYVFFSGTVGPGMAFLYQFLSLAVGDSSATMLVQVGECSNDEKTGGRLAFF